MVGARSISRTRASDTAWRSPGVRIIHGHPHRDVVDEDAMAALAMFAEALAVVRRHHDCRPIQRPLGKPGEQPPDHRVGVRDFGVIRLVLRGVRFRRAVRLVGIVEVDPREPRTRGLGLGAGWRGQRAGDLGTRGLGTRRGVDPGQRGPDDVLPAAFGAFGGIACVFFSVAIVVFVESAVETEPGVEHERADERTGAVARALQNRREGGNRRAETEEPVCAQAVNRGRRRGED